MTEKYIIRVTAGPDYDIDKHVVVPVNTPDPVKINSPFMDAELNVRLENYSGLPRGSPNTSPYFSTEPHASNKDKYSMAIRFTPKKPASPSASDSRTPPAAASSSSSKTNAKEEPSSSSENPAEDDEDEEDEDEDETAGVKGGISGLDLQFGNDFDHPIRDKLPPGFSYAMNIVKWWIDPGLEGDAYADAPYLYGPALSSFNAVHVGRGEHAPHKGGIWVEEGGDGDDEHGGARFREAVGAPKTAKERMKWALRKENKAKWVFEYGRTYCVDFFNPYLDFSDFSLRLPGFTLPIMKYWDGQPLRSENGDGLPRKKKRSHTLRYVLRNRATDDTYLVILFTLHLREDVDEHGELKPEALESLRQSGGKSRVALNKDELVGGEAGDEDRDYEEAKRKLGGLDIGKEEVGRKDVGDGGDDDEGVD
ncbi:putative f-box domain containing protein [Eutypa lata UCREL1]|uniref:Putative f-box domain containing protein n=1 Tax=Eutypa lata (strain UCR-EL1) TaxID=1287681 RepID=M7SXS6_EUTLA|nr:putative f-box domain containing protein [Eutypa lata UCREL1]